MASIYKEELKAAKWFAKQDELIIARKNDDYYITEGRFMVKVTEQFYNAVIREASDCFIELRNGTSAFRTKVYKGKGEMTLAANPFNPTTIFSIENTEEVVYKTKWIFDMYNDNFIHLRKFETEREHEKIFVNNDVLSILECFNPSKVWYGSGPKKPIMSDPDDYSAVLMLPVYINTIM